MTIITGDLLRLFIQWDQSRRMLSELMDYLLEPPAQEPTVCVLYGMHGTGKTTALIQAIQKLIRLGTEPEAIMYISGNSGDLYDDLCLELESRPEPAYLFIDNTECFGGILKDGRQLFQRLVCDEHKRVVLTGDNLLAMHLLITRILTTRCHTVSAPPLDFEEHSKMVLKRAVTSRQELNTYTCDGGLFQAPADVEAYILAHIAKPIRELYRTEQGRALHGWLGRGYRPKDWFECVDSIFRLSAESGAVGAGAQDGVVSEAAREAYQAYFSLPASQREPLTKRSATAALLHVFLHCGILTELPTRGCTIDIPFLRYHYSPWLWRRA